MGAPAHQAETTPTIGTVGERIRMARSEQRKTLRDLAESIHVSHSLIASWERGDVYPRLNEADALCQALGIDVSWLLDGLHATSISQAAGLSAGFRTGNR